MSSTAAGEARWICLAPEPESSGRCRQFVRGAFDQWGLEKGCDDAQLLVSELCSNVIRHAGTTMVVGVRWEPVQHCVRVSVRDGCALMPEVRARSDVSSSGRGLRMVRGIAQRWGVHRLPVGKIVWFELRVASPTR